MSYEYLRWIYCGLIGFVAGCGLTAWYVWRYENGRKQ